MRVIAVASVCLGLAVTGAAQSSGPEFEVASIKRNTEPPAPPLLDAREFRQSGRVRVINMTVLALLQVLYRVEKPVEITGGPSWIATERFDIVALGDPSTDREVPAGRTLPRMAEMMKSLLADRFQLRTHTEHRVQQGYILVPTNPQQPAVKLRRTTADCNVIECGSREVGPKGISGTAMSMDELASVLARALGIDAAVENQTGIVGRYDIKVTIADGLPAAAPEQGARVLTALREQLGLTLQPRPTVREVLVIDRIERPSEN